MTQSRKTIAIDFDGVIHQYDRGWQGGEIYGEPMPGAFENMAKLQKDFDLYILTTRATPETWYQKKYADGTPSRIVPHGGAAILAWMVDKGAEEAGVDLSQISATTDKRAAIAYIDDRAVRFTNWPDVRKMFQ